MYCGTCGAYTNVVSADTELTWMHPVAALAYSRAVRENVL